MKYRWSRKQLKEVVTKMATTNYKLDPKSDNTAGWITFRDMLMEVKDGHNHI